MYNTSQNYKDKVLADSTQHELNIYIGGNKVDLNHIIDFKQTIELFNNSEFCLGCTPEIDIEFEIDKRDLPEIYNEVYIETGIGDEIVPIGYFTIQKPIEDNEFKVKIKATDYMKKFEDNKYDGSDLTYPKTMLQVLQDICKKIGVELGSTSFLNSDKQIAVYDNTMSARTYLSYIAEQAGGIAVIGRDGKLYIRQTGQDVINFNINLFKDYKWGDKFKVSKVSYEDGIQDYKFGDETADTIYIDQNNMYIVDSEQIKNIYNQIKDFEIYSFEGETIIDPAYDLGDILVIDGKRVLYQGEINYEGKFKANIKSKIQAKTEQESMQTKENNATKMRRVESQIDQINGEITQVVQTTETLEEEITDITTTEATATGKNIHIEDSAEEPLVDIVVKGETKQETRSGKNILNVFSDEWVACSSVRQADGSIKANIQDNYYSMLRTTANKWKEYFLNNAGKRLTFSVKESFPDYTLAIVIMGERTSTTLGYQSIENTKGERSVSIKIADDFTSISGIELRFFRKIPVEKFTDTTSVISELQLEEGSVATDYEPYGASPSPDYPSEIENIEGKNKLPNNKAILLSSDFISKNSDGTFNIIAGTTTRTQYHTEDIFELKAGTYVFSCNKAIEKGVLVYLYNKTSNSYAIVLTPTKLKHTFSITERSEMQFIIVTSADNTYVGTTNIGFQLEEGTVATEYAPYNSLEFEVIGKNWFDNNQSAVYSTGNILTTLETGKRATNSIAGNYRYSSVLIPNSDNLLGKQIIISADITPSASNSGRMALFGLNSDNSVVKEFGEIISSGSKTITLPSVYPANVERLALLFYSNSTGTVAEGDYVDYTNVQVEIGNTKTDYEPYKSQTETFPLAEGQKLYEGSYLADDGIHQKFRELSLAIADMNNTEAYPGWANLTQLKEDYPSQNIRLDRFCNNAYCNITKNKGSIGVNTTGSGVLYLSTGTFGLTQTEWKEQYPDLVFNLQYELPEEEIIPYTEEQQEAWDRIKELHTYKNITNISSTADLDIVYVRDNGLADTYETKSNANQKYKETTEKFAETKMTTDGIKDTVSSIQTTTANNYTELTNKFNDYAPKSDVVTIQKSVEKIQTDTYTKTEINTKLMDGSVTKVSTTAGTFDENGLTIEKTDAKTKGNFNEKGIKVMDATSSSAEELLFAGYDEDLGETIVRTKNINVEKYLTKCNIAREEAYTNPTLGGKGIGVFIL